jgi:hypothetical protein
MHPLIIWLYLALVAWVPPWKKMEMYPEAFEREQDAQVRYVAIASDVLMVAFDPVEKPLFSGDAWTARSKTALLMLSVALKESGFRKDVDFGEGPQARGDNGRSVCLMQINVGAGLVPLPGEPGTWRADDLLKDRKKCFRAGLHMIRRSFHACPGAPLAAYASGTCDKGVQASANRISAYRRALGRFPIPQARRGTSPKPTPPAPREEGPSLSSGGRSPTSAPGG